LSDCEPELPECAPIVSSVGIGSQIRSKKKKPINKTSILVFRYCNGDTFAEGKISKPDTPESKLLQSIALSKKCDPKFTIKKKTEYGQVPVLPLVDPKISAIKKPGLQIQSCFTVNVERIIPQKAEESGDPSSLHGSSEVLARPGSLNRPYDKLPTSLFSRQSPEPHAKKRR
jgi:hypothetical protein